MMFSMLLLLLAFPVFGAPTESGSGNEVCLTLLDTAANCDNNHFFGYEEADAEACQATAAAESACYNDGSIIIFQQVPAGTACWCATDSCESRTSNGDDSYNIYKTCSDEQSGTAPSVHPSTSPLVDTTFSPPNACVLNCLSQFTEDDSCETICNGCWSHEDCLILGFTSVDQCYEEQCEEGESSDEEPNACDLNCLSQFTDDDSCETMCNGCWNHADCLGEGFTSVDQCYADHCDEWEFSDEESACDRNCVSMFTDDDSCETICNGCWNHEDCLGEGFTSVDQCYAEHCSEEDSEEEPDACELNCLSQFTDDDSCETMCNGCWNHADCLGEGFTTVDQCYANYCSEEDSEEDDYEVCVADCDNHGYDASEHSGCLWACDFMKNEGQTVAQCEASCESRTENGLYYRYEREACRESCPRTASSTSETIAATPDESSEEAESLYVVLAVLGGLFILCGVLVFGWWFSRVEVPHGKVQDPENPCQGSN